MPSTYLSIPNLRRGPAEPAAGPSDKASQMAESHSQEVHRRGDCKNRVLSDSETRSPKEIRAAMRSRNGKLSRPATSSTERLPYTDGNDRRPHRPSRFLQPCPVYAK